MNALRVRDGTAACVKMPQLVILGLSQNPKQLDKNTLVILGLSQNPKQLDKSLWLEDHEGERVFSHSLTVRLHWPRFLR